MAMGIDRQIQARMALGQDRLQQEYAQTQQLIDLLALQKLSKEKAEAARAIQASMQTNPATVKDQLEQQLTAQNRQGIAAMMPGIQMQGQRMAQAQARSAAGIPSQPAPNMARMAGGGIVAFQEGGDVDAVQEYIRLREKLRDPNTSPEARQTIQQMMEDMKRMSDDESRFIRDVETSSGFNPAKEYEESMNEMYGGGIVGYAPGGFVGPTQDMTTPTNDSTLAPISVQEARDIVAADDVGVFADLFGVGYKKQRRDAAFDVLKNAGYTRAQIERIRMGGETSEDMQAQMTDYSQRAAELESEIADRERFGGNTAFQRAELADLTRAMGITEDLVPITPSKSGEVKKPAPTSQKTPAVDEEMLRLYAEEDARVRGEREEKPKRQVDYDLLREFLLGGAGATSIAGALSGGGKGVGEELRRREARDIEQANLQADRELKQLALDYELSAANRKILADSQNVLTNAQMEIAAETLKDIQTGMNDEYLTGVKELRDEYEGEILQEKIAQLKQDIIRNAVGITTSLGSTQTTGDVISTTRISE